MRRGFAILCAIALLVGGLCGCGPKPTVTVYDRNGTVMATLTGMVVSADMLADEEYASYVELALDEAITALVAATETNVVLAQQQLFSGGYAIHTAFDPQVFEAMRTAVSQSFDNTENLTYGSALTDYGGNLLATYSVGAGNVANTAQSPHSSFKPLAVYAPAIEKGVVGWGSQVIDKPYKQVTGEGGEPIYWPQNATGAYTYQKTSLYECIRQSLNTAAVDCIKRLGVDRSIDFLQKRLGIDLTYEEKIMKQSGEDEIIGNIALGSLYRGVTPVAMAGYYQIFGNAGRYEAPHAVVEIRDAAGETAYAYAGEKQQILQPETAYIMNQLLRGVVEPGGTGENARFGATPVAGKTGTGDRYEGNWFVGVTPEYSCAVYYDDEQVGNEADALFAAIMQNVPATDGAAFPTCPTVQKGVFCSESGQLISSTCTEMELGYYVGKNKPETCQGH